MVDVFEKLYKFALFFNFCVFVFYVVFVGSVYNIPIQFSMGNINFSFSVNLLTMLFAIITIFTIIALVGTNVFGSGLSDTSITLIIKVTAYVIVWLVSSLFTLSFLSPIGNYGTIFYAILSVVYTLGFLQTLNKNSEV